MCEPPLFAATDTVHCGLHVIGDAPLGHAAKDTEAMPVSVKQHLVGLRAE
jgi:hypothetical protein